MRHRPRQPQPPLLQAPWPRHHQPLLQQHPTLRHRRITATNGLVRLVRDANKTQQLPAFGSGKAEGADAEAASSTSVHSCIGLVYYETDLFVTQAALAVQSILDMRLGDDNGRVHVKFVDWVKLDGPAEMQVRATWEETYMASEGAYASASHCVVLVESPPVFGPGTLGVANVCTYCNVDGQGNVAFVTSDQSDALTHITIAHEIGHLLCGTHTATGIMDDIVASNPNYDTFSANSSDEISQELERTDYGGPDCMSEFNGTSVVPHNEYHCDDDGYCYRRHHSHPSGALLFLGLFFVYFFFVGLVLVF